MANPFQEKEGTLPLEEARPSGTVRRFRITIMEGPKVGEVWQSQSDRCSIGLHDSNDLVVEDPTVSRFHCEVSMDGGGPRVRDLESRNGTVVDGV